ncbi:hypothetical protein [Clostridium sp. AF36-4]|jgi:hypothetical protein|uniref:hypothetical protein n=1 Tax=Clostridium sp. AF36-4 TaxID=2293015 RepID=UPI000E3F7C45|nr:hypothetical protein [Clostridium sp. AF36-4]RGF55198.1 hypothetical protein DW005_07630 [Clostridium sp. AF36-4]
MKKTHKKYVALLTTLAVIVCTLFYTNTAKADTENSWEPSDVVKVSKCTVNGSERTLTLLKNGDLYFQATETSSPKFAFLDVMNFGFDKMYGTVYVLTSENLLGWWNYDLTNSPTLNSVFKNMSNPKDPIGDIEKLLFDENNEFVIGYKTITGETYPTLTMSEMKAFLEIPDDPTPTPTPTAPVSTPSATPKVTPTTPPKNTTDPVVTPKTVTTKKVVKKKAGYSCLSIGNKVTSKYKLAKGKLTWKGSSKSKKYSGIKSAAFIKKSGNLVFLTKKGKVYTLSPKGKKKCIVKKKGKKLILKNKFAVKVQVGKKYINIVNK